MQTDELTYLLCGLIDGDVRAELPLTPVTISKRLSDKVDTSWTFGPTDPRTPPDWSTLIVKGETMIVAVDNGTPVQAWPITQFDSDRVAPTVGGPDLAGLLERVYVRDYEAYNVDEATICGELVNQVFAPGFDFTVRVYPSGTVRDVYYDGTADLTLRTVLDEYRTAEPSIDYVCDVEWVVGAVGRRIHKIIRIGSGLGRVDPDMVIDSSAIADYKQLGSFAEGQGATRLWGVSDGSGSARPMVGPFETLDIAQKGPWESRESYATVEDEDELEVRARRTLASRQDGTQVYEVTCVLDAMPKLIEEWDVGDVMTFVLDPSESLPQGGEFTEQVIGWDMDRAANTIALTFKIGDGVVLLRPTRNGAQQLWATIDDLLAFKQQMRSSQGVLNGGTVTKPGGIVVEGDGSIVSPGETTETRIRLGVVEERELPDGEWTVIGAGAAADAQEALNAAAQAVLDAAAALEAAEDKSTIVRSYADAPAGPQPDYKSGDEWRKVNGGLVVAVWQHNGAEFVPQVLTGTMLSADAIDGKVVTGATLQTSPDAARGVKVFSAGVIGYDADGNPKTIIDATTGKITAVDGDFTGTITGSAIAGGAISIAEGVASTLDQTFEAASGTSAPTGWTRTVVAAYGGGGITFPTSGGNPGRRALLANVAVPEGEASRQVLYPTSLECVDSFTSFDYSWNGENVVGFIDFSGMTFRLRAKAADQASDAPDDPYLLFQNGKINLRGVDGLASVLPSNATLVKNTWHRIEVTLRGQAITVTVEPQGGTAYPTFRASLTRVASPGRVMFAVTSAGFFASSGGAAQNHSVDNVHIEALRTGFVVAPDGATTVERLAIGAVGMAPDPMGPTDIVNLRSMLAVLPVTRRRASGAGNTNASGFVTIAISPPLPFTPSAVLIGADNSQLAGSCDMGNSSASSLRIYFRTITATGSPVLANGNPGSFSWTALP